jgi:hypothetical protein
MQCAGYGSPAIVPEAGAGNDGLTGAGFQTKVATYTQVRSYDRARMGWSDPRPLFGSSRSPVAGEGLVFNPGAQQFASLQLTVEERNTSWHLALKALRLRE